MNANPFNNSWAISRPAHNALRQVYRARRNDTGTLLMENKEQSTPKKTNPDFNPYQVKDGVAVISIVGVLTKDVSAYAWLTGGTSMKESGKALSAALSDTAIKAIVLYTDSPGGTVDGTHELASKIHAARGQKPIIAISDGQICSAAYWISAAADKIFITGNTVQVGSIGVVACHVDVSEQDKMFGEKITEITAGKYKRMAGNHLPLSEDGRAYLQEQVDSVYSVFIESVAKYRNITEKKALEMADGKVFIGQDALEIGLIDGIATFDEVLQMITSPGTQPAKKTIPAIQTFENLVYSHCQQGMPQQAAFKTAQQSHPALYEDFNRRLKTGQVEELFPNAIIGGRIIR